MLIRAYLVTALFMGLLGTIGLMTARDLNPATLNAIFFLCFFPSVAAGMIVFMRKKPQEVA